MPVSQEPLAHKGDATPGANRRGASASKVSPADRLLDAATALFSANGIRAVGIDRILSESGVARASLYSTFGSKDALVVAYLQRLDERDRTRWDRAVSGLTDPLVKVLTFFDLAIASAPVRNFRGCQYVNAVTEFPDENLPPVLAHREWFSGTLTGLLMEAGLADPGGAARRIQLIYDGALAGSKFEHSEEPIRLGRELAAIVAFGRSSSKEERQTARSGGAAASRRAG